MLVVEVVEVNVAAAVAAAAAAVVVSCNVEINSGNGIRAELAIEEELHKDYTVEY